MNKIFVFYEKIFHEVSDSRTRLRARRDPLAHARAINSERMEILPIDSLIRDK